MKKAYQVEEFSSLSQPHHHMSSTTTSAEPPMCPPAWLSLVLERLTVYFHDTILPDNLDLLNTSLYHLYQRVDSLYRISLPAIENNMVSSRQQPTLKSTQTTEQNHYRLWLDLQTIQRQLERIEILCHLLNASLYDVLLCLDHSRDIMMQDKGELDTPVEQHLHTQWTDAFAIVQKQTEQWLYERRSFLALFSDLSLTLPKLDQFDKRCMTLLESARTIFTNILPDIQAVSQGDDEIAAMLLLDLLQQSDQIVLQIAPLLETLQLLIKHYAIRIDE